MFRLTSAFLLLPFFLAAQDSSAVKKKMKDYVQAGGYLKDLQVVSFFPGDSIQTYNYIHNRLNFHFSPAKHLTAAVEVRNRIYYGQQVYDTPGYGKLVSQDNGYFNLSALVVNGRSFVATTMIDRGWIDWSEKKWEVRFGRQRINWGKTLVWNPNDLFNAFNFTDFDYEEQPGSDALRADYYPNGMSAVEMAVRPGRKKNEAVAAGLWRFNKRGYDIQLLGGLYKTDIAFGTGWAGNIGNAGFKGEATWFQPKDKFTDTSGVLSATMTADYSFSNTLYLEAAVLFNNHPVKNAFLFIPGQAAGTAISAKNLMPSEWSFFAQASGSPTPLITLSFASMYGADPGFVFIMPSCSYSISDNWDIMLLGQSVFFSSGKKIRSFSNAFLRLKWSF
ncbi:MAG TPA: DUF1302 family protein [Bacteroidia bacterium]|nr:DUF1302 family protein [Bacteroidia bacterium]